MKVFLAVSALAIATAATAAEPGHQHHSPQLGKLKFETSCAPAADALVQQGLGWLHSFQYPDAERTFGEAARADPACAIAHWGVAMSQYHPLWAPPTAAELATAKAALEAARARPAKTERERDYVAAIETFYRDHERLDHKARTLAYSDAMRRLHERYPADHEAAVFYALALAADGLLDNDPAFTKEKSAAAVLNRVLAENSDHPGVAHYLIHNLDYPPLAQHALAAARRYADLAPDSPHAQHMPSHIFVRLGLWDEAIRSNLRSEAAARAWAKANGLADSSSERLHAMDYLAYAYLQTGQDAKAQAVLDDLNRIRKADPPVFTVAYAATVIPARIALERRRWSDAANLELHENVRGLTPLANFQWAEAHVHYARAVGAARSGDAASARTSVAKLRAIEEALVTPPGTYDWKKQVAIAHQTAAGWLAHAEGRRSEAERLMRAAADLDDATEKHPVTPGALQPAREQLGELLLEHGQGRESLAEFESSLKRAPRRLAGLYGAMRAAKLVGDADKARRYSAQLAELTRSGDPNRVEVREARAASAELAAR
jgi:Tfp pilus assembly protein PilF